MKNKFLKGAALALLSLAIVTGESCRKEEPEPETIDTTDNNVTSDDTTDNNTGGNTGGGGSTTIQGCTDADSPLYNANANSDDGSCQFAYTASYTISYYPPDDNGTDWDLFFNTNADLVLRIKEQGASSYIFESDEKSDHDPSSPANWTAPNPIKLLNKTYEWELVDIDAGSPDDPISNGTFNPIALANLTTNKITTTAGGSELVISFTLQ